MWKLTLGFLACALAVALSMADEAQPASKAAARKLQKSYVWYDGDQPRRVWINPELMAEFDREDRDGRPEGGTVRSNFPKARALKGRHKGARIWQMEPGIHADAAAKHLNGKRPKNKYSPVFHDRGTNAARKRALPGNVIVFLNPDWDQSEVDQWASGRKLEIVKKLDIGRNVVVVKTGPGLETLEMANSLRGTEGVVSTTPDWWEEVTLR